MLREEIPEKWISCSNNKACAVTLATFRFRSPISNIQPSAQAFQVYRHYFYWLLPQAGAPLPSLDDPLLSYKQQQASVKRSMTSSIIHSKHRWNPETFSWTHS